MSVGPPPARSMVGPDEHDAWRKAWAAEVAEAEQAEADRAAVIRARRDAPHRPRVSAPAPLRLPARAPGQRPGGVAVTVALDALYRELGRHSRGWTDARREALSGLLDQLEDLFAAGPAEET